MSNSISPSPRDGAAETTADPPAGGTAAPAAAGADSAEQSGHSGGRSQGRPSPPPDGRAAAPRTAAEQPAAPAADRLVGIDVARGLAVLGMFVVHVGLGWSAADGSNALYGVVSGRSAALFALLAGVSIALLSGGPSPRSGHGMGVALWRVVIRGLIMLPVGTLLTMLGTPVSVILAYYAVFFVLAAPLMSERWKIVAGTAAVLGVLGPAASFYLRRLMSGGGPLEGPVGTVNSYDPLVALAGDGVVNFLVTGAYPAITWMPFVFAGMAIGRLRLRSRKVQWVLVGVGAGLAAVAYTASWAALSLGGRARLEASFDASAMQAHGGASSVGEALREGFPGAVPVNDWAWLLVSSGHSGTPFEVFGAGGIGIAVLGLCLIVAPYVRWAVYPLAAVGALALTTYVGHVLVIGLAESGLVAGTPLGFVSDRLDLTVLLGALVFATVWRLLVRRGPLEWPLHAVSMWAARRIP